MLRTLVSFIQTALDTILPRKNRTVRIDQYSLETITVHPEAHEACGVSITTLLHYRDTATEDLIRALKYDASDHAAKLLASVLAEYLREEIASIHAFSPKPIVLIPMPLHEARLKERGFNQVERILHLLPDEFKDGSHARLDTASLVRSRSTLQQTKLSRTERLANVREAFQCVKNLRDAHVILIDDVATTGATLAAARRALNGSACTLIAIAHA